MMLRILVPALALLAFGCGAPATQVAEASFAAVDFDDLPVPRGFDLLTNDSRSGAVTVGNYRSAELVYEGVGAPVTIENYYRERMPLYGWETCAEGWRKGNNVASLAFTPYSEVGYASSGQRIRYILKLRSER